MKNNIKIALVDDHVLLRKGLASLLATKNFEIVVQANNGQELIEKLSSENVPQVALLDINMPLMDGYATALWLRSNYPEVKILALSVYDDEASIIRMLHCGARGYILKDCDPSELIQAVKSLMDTGYYHSELVSLKIMRSFGQSNNNDNTSGQGARGLSEKEIQFLKWICSELTYKEIAAEMKLSPRTVDGYRDGLFEKLGIKSRVGLVLFAIRNQLVHL